MRLRIVSISRLAAAALSIAGLSACSQTSTDPSGTGANGTDPNAATKAALERLQLRIDQLEATHKDTLPVPADSNEKTPAGPIDSLTLQLGTNDDRLRVYWKDGQTSNLECTEEGKGRWACG